ncbi:unnamed protein product [Sphenostylis stenocarpa]|uniref:Uncharacterized protein n=1 Tax=Sphenostylis stenocarpa TaxID=92480 RepID=A0AA86TJM6_9FABA|nr:unnamed protein product [Sphenostylis stenocarpa]
MNGTVYDPLEKQWYIGRRIQRNISKFKKEEKVGAMTDDDDERLETGCARKTRNRTVFSKVSSNCSRWRPKKIAAFNTIKNATMRAKKKLCAVV